MTRIHPSYWRNVSAPYVRSGTSHGKHFARRSMALHQTAGPCAYVSASIPEVERVSYFTGIPAPEATCMNLSAVKMRYVELWEGVTT